MCTSCTATSELTASRRAITPKPASRESCLCATTRTASPKCHAIAMDWRSPSTTRPWGCRSPSPPTWWFCPRAFIHMKLRPVDSMTDGVFLCGLAHSPKTIEESILQAQAAVARAASILARDTIELEANISQVVDESCDGCAYCVDTCPYKAITMVEYKWQGAIKKVVET